MDPLTLALTGLAGGVQAVGSMLPTKQSKYNKEQLDELLRRQKAGGLGLTAEERQALEREQLNPVRALASEARRAQEATAAMASGGSGIDAAELNRIRSGEQAALAQAAGAAGQAIGRANVTEAARERQEIEQRLAMQAQRNTDVVNGVTGLLGTTAQMAGQVAGGPPSMQLMGLAGTAVQDFGAFQDQLRSAGLSDADSSVITDLAARYGPRFARVVSDTLSGGPLADPDLAAILGGG